MENICDYSGNRREKRDLEDLGINGKIIIN
jgi:hypothetical protein